jgi:hypothetical protein
MTLYVYPPVTVSTAGLATETTLQSIDLTLDAIGVLLVSLEAKDFATQTTLAAVNTSVTNKLAGNPVNVAYDSVVMDRTPPTSNILTYRVGGAAGTIVKTKTLQYTDATKTVFVSSVTV